MGQYLQDMENYCFVSYLFKKYSLPVTKHDRIDLILQLVLDICIILFDSHEEGEDESVSLD